MRSFRVPIWVMMGGIAAVAVCAFLLRSPNPSPVMTSMVFTAMLTVMILSVLAAIGGPWRTYWIGFAVTGGIYAILAFGPGAGTSTRPMLLTSFVIDAVYERLEATVGRSGGGGGAYLATHMSWPEWSQEAGDLSLYRSGWAWQRYQRIGHSLATLAHAIAGGLALLGFQWWKKRNATTGS